nr:HNH endonuclease [uncultured Rhodopila sp.]
MAKRKDISASLRWSVFARDGFACRYCGARAGQEGVELHADHVVSVAEGGGNTYDNLVTACNKCNGGKGARSLSNAPTSAQVIDRLTAEAKTLQDQAEAMALAIAADKRRLQEAVNIKCSAYETNSVIMDQTEARRIANWCREFGADRVLEWYGIAFRNGVYENKAVRYVSSIVKNIRAEEGE